MQLTITTWDDRVISVELDGDDPLDNLRAILEVETGVPGDQQALFHNNRQLTDGQTLGQQQVQEGDLIMLVRRPAANSAGPPAAAAAAPQGAAGAAGLARNPDGSAVDPRMFLQLLNNPQHLRQLPPEMAEAVRAGDINKLQEELRRLHRLQREAAAEELKFMRMAEEDPFNPEVQRRLEEAIQQKNIMENFEQALEHNPEAFGSVCMLYVKMEVNGHPLKAFIDSGAQMTIMGRSCAERCGLLRLMDKRWQGTAVGVGSAKILGRIHMVPLKAGNHFFPVSITVLDQDSMDFLFGLDNLKRHQCLIDLKDNVLRFTSTDAALPFLPEHEIPVKERLEAAGDLPMTDAAAPQQQQQQPAAPAPAPAQQAGGAGHTAAAPPAAAAPAPPPAEGLPAGWNEKVEQLQALGFPREACLAVLRQTHGNVDMAASLLFSAAFD